MAKQTNPDEREKLDPASDLTRFMELAGSRRFLKMLCRDNGGVFVQLPDAQASPDDVFAAFSRIVSEVGEDSEALRLALSDARLLEKAAS